MNIRYIKNPYCFDYYFTKKEVDELNRHLIKLEKELAEDITMDRKLLLLAKKMI